MVLQVTVRLLLRWPRVLQDSYPLLQQILLPQHIVMHDVKKELYHAVRSFLQYSCLQIWHCDSCTLFIWFLINAFAPSDVLKPFAKLQNLGHIYPLHISRFFHGHGCGILVRSKLGWQAREDGALIRILRKYVFVSCTEWARITWWLWNVLSEKSTIETLAGSWWPL